MVTTRVRLRRAGVPDAPAIAACVDAAYRHYIPRIGKPPGPMLADYATAVQEREVWVAELDGAIVGTLVLVPAGDHLLLDNIAVHPDSQGQGLGRMLLEFADREALRQGFSELRLYTHRLMTENIALYTRIGWEETGRGEQNGYDRVFFRKRLSPPEPGADS